MVEEEEAVSSRINLGEEVNNKATSHKEVAIKDRVEAVDEELVEVELEAEEEDEVEEVFKANHFIKASNINPGLALSS